MILKTSEISHVEILARYLSGPDWEDRIFVILFKSISLKIEAVCHFKKKRKECKIEESFVKICAVFCDAYDQRMRL